VEQKIALLDSFSDSLRAAGIEPDVRVLRLELASVPSAVRRALEVPLGKHVVLERLALVEDEPVAALTAWLPAPRFSALVEMSLDRVSLYALLRREWLVEVARATAEIEVVRCNSRQAQLLGVGRSSPALRVLGVTFDQTGAAIEYSDVLYRADRFRFTLESFREGARLKHVVPRRMRDEREVSQ
jgi:GntR family transcriptional regulator